MTSEPYENPFESEKILVQSPGMSQWLKMALAEELGVSANIEFPLPATFIWDIFTLLLPEVPRVSAFNKESMIWKLVQLLPKLKNQTEFSPIAQYLERDPSDLNLYQLCEKIADIFDSYLVYRPEWIDAWEHERDVDDIKIKNVHPWQPILWRELYGYTIELGQSHYHRANLYDALIKQLSSKTFVENVLPKRVFIFGITALPPRYIDALTALGEHIDIHLMFTNPCQYYWGDVRDRKTLARIEQKKRCKWQYQGNSLSLGESDSFLKGSIDDNVEDDLHTQYAVGNELLASMGKLGRDNLWLLSQLPIGDHELFIDIPRDNLLHHLQSDILHLEEHQNDEMLFSSHHKQTIQGNDHSLSFHRCHTPVREVEVLYDYLLSLFDNNSELKPKDIIVMVADINTYSPAIQAVFGNASNDRYIPFSISDRTASQESPIFNAFLHIMNLPRSRCLASELLELLEVPSILRCFNIDDDEFIQVKRWIEETGIRWGLNRETAKELHLPEMYQNTWEFGIARMLSGYAMSDDIDWLIQDGEYVAPYDEVQGLGAELAGKLSLYIEKIRHYRYVLTQQYCIDEWRAISESILNDFFSVDLEEEMSFYTLRDLIGQLKQQLDDSLYYEQLTFDLLVYYFSQKLSTTRVSQRFLAGQVNFCTLMPMRSIPFKVVCLLGMNDGVYPRTIPAEGFDLMSLSGRRGDRSRRDDDRYLFLEALISAQNFLYISYVGQSIRDNSPLSPSVLVTELTEYCSQNYCLIDDIDKNVDVSGLHLLASITHVHSMVPYSPKAFIGEKASYASEWLPSAQRIPVDTFLSENSLVDYWLDKRFPLELDVIDFQRFWRLPVQYFFNVRLGVYFDEPLTILQDEEPFTLGYLDNYLLMEELIPLMLDEENTICEFEHLRQTLSAQGRLPIGAFGELDFQQQMERVSPLVDILRPLCHHALDDQEIVLTFDSLGEDRPIRLVGWITKRFQSGLVRYRPGKMRAQDYVSSWIEHLSHAAMGGVNPTHMIALSENQGAEHHIFREIDDVQWAKEQLDQLMEFYTCGMNSPLPYFPRTALAGVESQYLKGQWMDNDERYVEKMMGTFYGDHFMDGEGMNVYISRVWSEWNESLAEQLKKMATDVLAPPIKYVRKYQSREE